MAKLCDNKSVGILVWKDEKLLMIERKKYNFGYAIPAGHLDGDTAEDAARTELEEEVGLTAQNFLKKLELDLPNPCRREGGTHHEWTIFEAGDWRGEIKPSPDETKSYFWADKNTLRKITERLENFAGENNIPLALANLPQLVAAANEIASWQENPGLEPPMYFLLSPLLLKTQ